MKVVKTTLPLWLYYHRARVCLPDAGSNRLGLMSLPVPPHKGKTVRICRSVHEQGFSGTFPADVGGRISPAYFTLQNTVT